MVSKEGESIRPSEEEIVTNEDKLVKAAKEVLKRGPQHEIDSIIRERKLRDKDDNRK